MIIKFDSILENILKKITPFSTPTYTLQWRPPSPGLYLCWSQEFW